MFRRLRMARMLAAAAVAAALAPAAGAHDVPDRMDVHAFLKQDGRQVELVVRTPLALLQSIGLPKRGPGYLDLARVEPHLARAASAVAAALPLYADGERVRLRRTGTQLARPANGAFAAFASAKSHVQGPLPPASTNIFWNQGYFDVAFAGTLPAADAALAIEPAIAAGLSGRISLLLRHVDDDGVTALNLAGSQARVYLDPGAWHAASTFVAMGVRHIFSGLDHVLFIVALVLPFALRDAMTLVKIVTGFTVAHSLTLSASALGIVAPGPWFPPLVEVLIAASIVYMAVENVVCAALARTRLATRWATAGGFGLIHGFGFAFVLQEKLQLSGDHLILSLAAFNIGVEVGQLAILAVVLPLLALVLREARARRVGVIVVSVLAGHTAWHWMTARFADLQGVRWPEAPVLAALAVAAVLAIAGALWLARRPRLPRPPSRPVMAPGGGRRDRG